MLSTVKGFKQKNKNTIDIFLDKAGGEAQG